MDIKDELRLLIEGETDYHILEAIRTLLRKTTLDPILKQKLSSRALKAEQDIKEGKLFEGAEVDARLKKNMGL